MYLTFSGLTHENHKASVAHLSDEENFNIVLGGTVVLEEIIIHHTSTIPREIALLPHSARDQRNPQIPF